MLTEYWLTQAGRGAFRDQVDDAKLGVKRLNYLLSSKNGTIAEKIEAERYFREWTQEGFFETDGKSKEEIVKEAQERLGTDVDILFYDGKTIGDLTGEQLEQFNAYGFVKKDDGSIWINTGMLDNNTIDLNKLFFHEYAHSNGLNEAQANYIEDSYGLGNF
ncbi:hypothetical protein [Fusobacterium sp. PH5-44]|uniref:hypothetical protein n=1 Tax=unclassified Fusobacterium TaxID=2648384 RepID=UPI003D2013A3